MYYYVVSGSPIQVIQIRYSCEEDRESLEVMCYCTPLFSSDFKVDHTSGLGRDAVTTFFSKSSFLTLVVLRIYHKTKDRDIESQRNFEASESFFLVRSGTNNTPA